MIISHVMSIIYMHNFMIQDVLNASWLTAFSWGGGGGENLKFKENWFSSFEVVRASV